MSCRIKLRYFLLLFISFFGNCSELFNSHGQLGYINTPSAFTMKANSVSFGIDRGIPDRKIFLIASPFDRIDATLFYADITGRKYGSVFKQSYKDKGFSFKYMLKEADKFPAIAIGINDLAGTGLYSSEYLVLSNNYKKLNYSLGIGWGQYSSGINFRNPLGSIDKNFYDRPVLPNDFIDQGGSFTYKNYFSGQTASIFGGVSYKFNNNLDLILEYDPTLMPGPINYETPKSNINFGLGFSTKYFGGKLSFIRGNEISLQFNYQETFNSYEKAKFKSIDNKIDNFEQLQRILELNDIGLVSVKSNHSNLEIIAKQNSYYDQSTPNKIIKNSSSKLRGQKILL